jgi:hypothetical protein
MDKEYGDIDVEGGNERIVVLGKVDNDHFFHLIYINLDDSIFHCNYICNTMA